MDKAALKERILGLVTDAEFQENKQFPMFVIPPDKMHALAVRLKEDPDLSFDYLFCLSGVDMLKYFEVVYHMESTTLQHQLVLKVRTADRENAAVDTVCDIWRTAELHEREVYDLLGVKFNNHPDLRRFFLEENWKGHPLRKDYVDEVNIVEL
ncbi:MAG TPA: NADH-quinone oxidoreductase subunit C [Bacteroidales bacterium]|nr:NADH-quinone oxidoreductase subunit C [Bacteroidales bacterium]HPS49598.1 NADH-quinone oxidoreductase subunit C [Bacteroidales bacterium]